jgi:hypothetical protein
MRRNLSSGLKSRWRQSSMSDFDRLPPQARAWLREAKLPWSTTSVLKMWQRVLRETGSATAARERLSRAEEASLAREAAIVWGLAYPKATTLCPPHGP